jgi:CIC family chloride channel protein
MLKKIFLAIGLGLVAGLASELLVEAIHMAAGFLSAYIDWYLLPLIGGVVIAFIRKYFLGKNRSFGLDEIHDELEMIEFKIMDMRDTIVKSVLTFVTLVFGFSAGKFGPLIHMGGSIGSKLSYHMEFEEEDIRYFIASGVAAALAGFFTNPLFGIFFIFEILLKYQFNYRIIYPIVAAVATLIPSEFVINHKFFEFTHGVIDLTLNDLLPKIMIIGIVTGLIACIYQLVLEKSKDFLNKNEKWYYPLIAGGLMAIIGWQFPLTYEIYYDLNQVLLNRELLMGTVGILLLLKLLTTGITFSLGGMGGGFAPAITIGMLSGYLISGWFDLSNCGNIFGMVGMMAGYSNAPIATAVLFSNMMGDFNLFLPLLLLGTLSSQLNRFVMKKRTKK